MLVFDTAALLLKADVEGFGLAYMPQDEVQTYLNERLLVRV